MGCAKRSAGLPPDADDGGSWPASASAIGGTYLRKSDELEPTSKSNMEIRYTVRLEAIILAEVGIREHCKAVEPSVRLSNRVASIQKACGVCFGLWLWSPAIRRGLAAMCEHLTLVDSEPQIERVQQLDGTRAKISEFVASTWANARVLTFEAFEQDQSAYDFIL